MGVYATRLLRGFKGQHTNPAKHERRRLLKTIGRCQLLKRVRAERRLLRAIRFDELKTAFIELAGAKGVPAAKEILASLGAERLPDLKPAQYGAAMALVKQKAA